MECQKCTRMWYFHEIVENALFDMMRQNRRIGLKRKTRTPSFGGDPWRLESVFLRSGSAMEPPPPGGYHRGVEHLMSSEWGLTWTPRRPMWPGIAVRRTCEHEVASETYHRRDRGDSDSRNSRRAFVQIAIRTPTCGRISKAIVIPSNKIKKQAT